MDVSWLVSPTVSCKHLHLSGSPRSRDQMSPDQLATHFPDIVEALHCLNKSLLILDMAGFSVAAIHVDAAIVSLRDSLHQSPETIPKSGSSAGIDFSTLDSMCVNLFGSS
jgi:hypothetical protein